MMLRSTTALLALLTVLSPLAATEADACCNVIPVAAKRFPSTQGSVSRALAGPDAEVEITLNPACSPTAPTFDPATWPNNVVTLEFNSPLGGKATAMGADVRVPDPLTLWFKIPDTMKSHGKEGLSGPTRITVRNPTNQVVADIGPLFEPTDGCDKHEEAIFKSFTVLPPPNDLGRQIGDDQRVLATLDGGENVLVPLDHSKILPKAVDTPVAIYERGYGWTQLSDALKKASPSSPDLGRAFTLEGYPLPPLLRVDGTGALLGTADYPTSVLRISRLDGNGQAIYDLKNRLTRSGPEVGTGPIVVDNLWLWFILLKRDFKVAKCYPVPLATLRSSDRAVAYARDERLAGEPDLNGDGDRLDRVVQLVDPASGGRDCGSETGFAVTEIDASRFLDPVLEAGGPWVAFLKSEAAQNDDLNGDGEVNDILGAFKANGKEATDPPNVVAEKAPGIDAGSLAISGPLVFFRTPPGGGPPAVPSLRVFDAAKETLRNVKVGATRAAVAGKRAVVVTPEGGAGGTDLNSDGDTNDDVAQRYDGALDTLASLGVAARAVAISDTLVGVTVPEAMQRNLDRNGDGDTLDDVLAVFRIGASLPPENVGVAANAARITGSRVVFTTREVDEGATGSGCSATNPPGGCDLNGDGDARDIVLRFLTVGPPGTSLPPISEVRQDAVDFVVGGDLVAFRTREASQGNIPLTGDGDTADAVMQVYDLATGEFYATGQAAIPCNEPSLRWMRPYKVEGNNVFFLTRESDQGKDLNGDGDMDDTVLQIFNVRSRRILVLATVGGASAVPAAFPQQLNGRTILHVRIDGAPSAEAPRVIGDQDGDGALDPFDSCVEKKNADQKDLDLDGLGDRACDRTACSAFVPVLDVLHTRRGRACQNAAADAGLAYLQARAEATRRCLEKVTAGDRDTTNLCRGYFVRDVEILPQNPKTARVLAEAGRSLTGAVEDACPGETGTALARDVRRAYGETVNAITDAVYADVQSRDESIRECQHEVGEAASAAHKHRHAEPAGYLERVVAAVKTCLDEHAGKIEDDPASVCLGRLEKDGFVPPSDGPAATAIAGAEATLRAAVKRCSERAAASLDPCGADVKGSASCLVCAGWRRAAEAIRTVYAPPVARARASRPGAARAVD